MVLSLVQRTPLHQLFFVTLVGVASGVYIYKPLLEKHFGKRDPNAEKKDNDCKPETASITKKTDVSGPLLIRVKGKEREAFSE